MEIPVYLFTGFLESGKTTFIKTALFDENFTEGEKTLLIVCEEGLEEFDELKIKKANAAMVKIESKEQCTPAYFKALEEKYKPKRVMMEYNGTWKVPEIQQMVPENWLIYQIVDLADARTLESYMANMGPIILDQLINADLIILNRADEKTMESLRARNLRAINPRATIFFDKPDGSAEEYGGEIPVPYDMDAPVIEIKDEDFGIWYVDAMNDPQKYEGKTVRFKGMYFKPKGVQKGYFVPGRFGMVCCAEDITFLGFLCTSPEAGKYHNEDWLIVTAEIKCETMPQYRGEGPVLYAKSLEAAQKPKDEVVTFS